MNSSGRTEVLLRTWTWSMLTVGTSARMARRRELARLREVDWRTKSTRSRVACKQNGLVCKDSVEVEGRRKGVLL